MLRHASPRRPKSIGSWSAPTWPHAAWTCPPWTWSFGGCIGGEHEAPWVNRRQHEDIQPCPAIHQHPTSINFKQVTPQLTSVRHPTIHQPPACKLPTRCSCFQKGGRHRHQGCESTGAIHCWADGLVCGEGRLWGGTLSLSMIIYHYILIITERSILANSPYLMDNQLSRLLNCPFFPSYFRTSKYPCIF